MDDCLANCGSTSKTLLCTATLLVYSACSTSSLSSRYSSTFSREVFCQQKLALHVKEGLVLYFLRNIRLRQSKQYEWLHLSTLKSSSFLRRNLQTVHFSKITSMHFMHTLISAKEDAGVMMLLETSKRKRSNAHVLQGHGREAIYVVIVELYSLFSGEKQTSLVSDLFV